MSDDKMRAEFEAWAKAELTWPDQNFRLDAITGDSYFYTTTNHTYRIWQAAYAAGQEAEREAIVNQVESLVTECYEYTEKPIVLGIAEVIRNKPEGER
jgi:hypothetical protein